MLTSTLQCIGRDKSCKCRLCSGASHVCFSRWPICVNGGKPVWIRAWIKPNMTNHGSQMCWRVGFDALTAGMCRLSCQQLKANLGEVKTRQGLLDIWNSPDMVFMLLLHTCIVLLNIYCVLCRRQWNMQTWLVKCVKHSRRSKGISIRSKYIELLG